MTCNSIIYVVDPDRGIAQGLSVLLASYGLSVRTFVSAEAFLRAADSGALRPGCILVEQSLRGMDGLALVRAVMDRGIHMPALVMTNDPSEEFRAEALNAGAKKVIVKPLMRDSVSDLLSTLRD